MPLENYMPGLPNRLLYLPKHLCEYLSGFLLPSCRNMLAVLITLFEVHCSDTVFDLSGQLSIEDTEFYVCVGLLGYVLWEYE